MSATPGFTRHLAYADVGNYGLAHSLLAWARCRVWCDRNRVPMLAPSWLRLRGRIGPIIRGERDSRQYHRLFHFPGYVRGLRRWHALASYPRVAAEAAALPHLLEGGERRLVVFSNRMSDNEETHVHEVIGHGAELRTALATITRPRYLPKPATGRHVAIHVRMGDFSVPPSLDALRRGAKNSRIATEWYGAMLNGLRERIGPLPAVVYSDGSDESLSELLTLPQVQRSPRQPSVTDLLGIAQSQLVISSGSGFSMWGAFLANAPRICFTGQRFTRVLPANAALDLEPECESVADLPEAFIEHVLAHVSGP